MLSAEPSSSIPTCIQYEEVISGGSSKWWIPFDIEDSPRSPQIEILKSDEDSCVISATVYGMYRDRIEIEGEIFDELTLPGCGHTNELGRPRLPVIRGMIEVPPGKQVGATKVVHHEELSRHFINSCPVLSFVSFEEANEDIRLSDQNSYSPNLYYPDTLVSVGQPAQLRDHTVVQVNIYPVRFNSILNKFNISKHIKIELKFHNLSEEPTRGQKRLYSNAFEEICRDVIWNHQIFSQTSNLETLQQSLGYLVISTDPFYSYLDSFVDWKESNGLNVTTTKMPIGVDDEIVYIYISNAYNYWEIPPTYVLLVGDVEYLPTHYGLVGVDGSLTATDHYYSCVDGDDYLPDLFVGRLSVKNVTELNNTLNKLMGYRGFCNNRATMTVDVRTYVDPNIEVVDSVCDSLCNKGYIVDKFLWGHSARNISDSVNEGRAIVNYYGGGVRDRWLGPHPDFTCSDILELTNEGEYPIVFSFTCWTGCYDYSSDCLGETWIKSDRKGSVAFFGSSREAEGPWINEMQKGAYKAIFDDALNEFGAIAAKAKLYMYNALGDLPINDTEIHFEIFNVLTDPQLNVFPSPTYTLTLSCTSNGELNPTPRRYTYCNEQNVSVEAIPDTGYYLDRWELDGETIEPYNPINVVMNSSHTLHAIFTEQPYEVTINAHCNIQGADIGVNITMDGSPTAYT
ncbi:MAG: C25 family cysteine peptidase, partial [Candidatus Bathyarchaeota archaeon]